MPVKKQEAHRALELLEEYHSKLTRPEDRQLQEAIERVIMIFKGRLFQALLDLQEFYEQTLLDESKSLSEKAAETNRMADRWESNPPFNFAGGAASTRHEDHKVNGSSHHDSPDKATVAPILDEWEHEDITLEKSSSGLGFSLAGGVDNLREGSDPSIYITRVIPGGAAAKDGRLKKGDIILRVNGIDFTNIRHSVAVETLKNAGSVVKLFVRRRRTRSVTPESAIASGQGYQSRIERIELNKGTKGLGFSIAGGVGNEHVPGDSGIYVTKIIDGGAAQMDGRMQVGDKILAVGNTSFENVTHETAVAALKATSDRVVLSIAKTSSYQTGAQADSSFNQSYSWSDTLPVNQPHGDGKQHQPTMEFYAIGTSKGDYENRIPAPPAATGYLPAVALQPEPAEITRIPRRVTLTKGPAGLGFNIVGGEDGEGIYISYIVPGGVAELSGALFRGDQLIEVNNVDLSRATHEEAAAALKNSGQRVALVAQYQPEAFARFEAKINQLREELIHPGQPRHHPQMPHLQQPLPKRELHVRALYDYDPSKDSGLPSRGLAFNYGDILHVTNASDDDWWQARKVLSDGVEEGYGIIPSKRRVEKRERARRKQVNFGGNQSGLNDKHSGSKKSLSLSRKFPFMKSKERISEESDAEKTAEDVIHSYEAVERRHLNYARPVVILGPLKDRINDDLLAEFPDRFGSCVPHTSRTLRQNEIDGRDYHFVSREQMEFDIANHKFIEAGQYNQNLYGTSVESVRKVADQGRHCILDVSGNALKRLHTAGLYPIAIFVKPYSADQLCEWNRRLTEEEAERQYQRALQVEQDFADHFAAIVQGNTPEELYSRVKEIIREQSSPLVWVPAPDRL